MDPDANLKEQLEIAREIILIRTHDNGLSLVMHKALRLAELVEALDEWIGRNGALPKRWEKKQ